MSLSTQTADRQMLYLFFCNFAILFTGMGLFPILPLYAGKFGATPTVVGIYLALTYAAITAGGVLTGWLAGRLSRKSLFVAAGVLGIPALVLLGQAIALWQVVVLTGIVWFSGGVGIALVSVFTGLHASQENRGKTFGFLFLTMPLAAILGGTVVGWLLEWQGYPLMFVALALVWIIWPLLALWKVEYPALSAPTRPVAARDGASLPLGRAFLLLLLAALLSSVTLQVSRFGLSLSMQASQFTLGAIAGATVVGGLVTIPILLLLGTLSDRLGRRRFLVLGYLVAAGGAITLSAASELWQFWLASAMLIAATATNGSVASAFATDFLSPEALSRGLPWLNTMGWIASILGFTGAGYVIDAVGLAGLFLIATALPVIAISLLMLLPAECQPAAPQAFEWQGNQFVAC